MNYRHAYHAGNAADCMKHALLVWLLGALRRKPAGFTVLDTHAGTGIYDLTGAQATTTGEWQRGIGRLREDGVLDAYLRVVEGAGAGWYPGSPAIIHALLRPQDRLICCELHGQDADALRRRYRGDPQVAVHGRDGYEALGALLPPLNGRGLVLIDPPFEQTGEAERVVAGLRAAQARWRGGVLAAWYPIKHLAPVRALHRAATGLRDVVVASLTLRPPEDAGRLNGCGLLVVNPPFGFAEGAAAILTALRVQLGEAGSGCAVERLADE